MVPFFFKLSDSVKTFQIFSRLVQYAHSMFPNTEIEAVKFYLIYSPENKLITKMFWL